MATTAALSPSQWVKGSGATLTLTITSDARISDCVIDGSTGTTVFHTVGTEVQKVSFMDSLNRTWTQQSDDGKVAVFTSKA